MPLKDPAKRREYQKQYREKNREKILQKKREYYNSEQGKQKRTEWNEKNHEKVLEYKRAEYERNKEKYHEYEKTRRNKDERKKQMKNYYENNKDNKKQYRQTRMIFYGKDPWQYAKAYYQNGYYTYLSSFKNYLFIHKAEKSVYLSIMNKLGKGIILENEALQELQHIKWTEEDEKIYQLVISTYTPKNIGREYYDAYYELKFSNFSDFNFMQPQEDINL